MHQDPTGLVAHNASRPKDLHAIIFLCLSFSVRSCLAWKTCEPPRLFLFTISIYQSDSRNSGFQTPFHNIGSRQLFRRVSIIVVEPVLPTMFKASPIHSTTTYIPHLLRNYSECRATGSRQPWSLEMIRTDHTDQTHLHKILPVPWVCMYGQCMSFFMQLPVPSSWGFFSCKCSKYLL